jgi:choline dehydrogenase-like flavoprotein
MPGSSDRMHDHYDIVILGSGAGGGTMARALSDTSARILIVERGDFVPQEAENWSPQAVWRDLRYRATERWLDERGDPFHPYTHYNVGGNSKFWGCVLYRLRREDFQEMAHVDGLSPGWPVDYDTMAPFYDRAERLYHVHGQAGVDPTDPPRGPFPYAAVPHAPAVAAIVEQLKRQGLHPSPLPLGLIGPGEPGGCVLCDTCNSFVCRIHAKSDAEVCGIRPALAQPNVELWTNAHADRLVLDSSGRRIEAVELTVAGEQRRVTADRFIVSCGAVNSAALLLRSRTDTHPAGLANSSGLVGRRYMAHLATMVSGIIPVPWRRNTARFQKTVAINDFYLAGQDRPFPLGHIQTQGRVHPITVRSGAPAHLRRHASIYPLWVYDLFWTSRSVDWLVMSEDLPLPENRVTIDRSGGIRLEYRPSNVSPHTELVQRTKQMLARLGLWFPFAASLGSRNTTHQCGTLCFGTDPRTSVLDPFCRAHDIENLFVVDASFFPSSAAVNPALTIIAQALRVADHIKEEL